MVTRGIKEYMARNWSAARDQKDAYWGERIARLGPAEGIRVAGELRRQMLALNPDWPSAEDREADLQHHIRLASLFRRSDSAFRP